MDTVPLIAIIVCVTAVTLIFTILFTAIGYVVLATGHHTLYEYVCMFMSYAAHRLYVYCRHSDRKCTSHWPYQRRRTRKKHPAHRVPVPGQLTPSAPRHFSQGIRSEKHTWYDRDDNDSHKLIHAHIQGPT